jgi:hypothetical protein
MSDETRKARTEAWLAWYHKAEEAYDLACDHAAGLWLKDRKSSEGYQEAVEAVTVARHRWTAALMALNAYMDNEARTPQLPPERNPDGSDWWNVEYTAAGVE